MKRILKSLYVVILITSIVFLSHAAQAEDLYEALLRQIYTNQDPRDLRELFDQFSDDDFYYTLAHVEARVKALGEASRYENWRAWMMSDNLGDDDGISLTALTALELFLIASLIIFWRRWAKARRNECNSSKESDII